MYIGTLLSALVIITGYPQQVQHHHMETNNIVQVIRNIFGQSDARQWDKVAGSFAPSVVLDYTSMNGGTPATLTPQQLTAAWQQVLPGFFSTHHQVSGFSVNIQGRRATASCHGLALHYLPVDEHGPVWVVTGTYDFDLQQEQAGWKVTRMRFNLQQQAGNLQLPALAMEQVKAERQWKKMALTPVAHQAVENFFTALERKDIHAFMQAWGPDGRQVMPLSPEGFPGLLADRNAIYNQYKGLPENYNSMQFPRKLFATDRPDLVIAQYSGTIALKDGGEYNNNYAGLFRIANGKISEFTEYFDPQILASAFGTKLHQNFNISNDSTHVQMKPVTFTSNGLVLKGRIFLPVSFNENGKYPAVVVAGSWTTVKEQMAARYAQELAASGYAALTFDYRYYGESEGEPRQYENPGAKIADVREAVSWLAAQPFVDKDHISAVGICASAGYMAGAAAADPRIRTVVCIAPWLHNAALLEAAYSSRSGGVAGLIAAGETAARAFADKGEVQYIPAASNTDSSAAMFWPGDVLDYYLNPAKGAVPEWSNRLAVMSWAEWLRFDGVAISAQVKQPLYIIHSENAAIPDGAKQFYSQLQAPKEITWLNQYNQFDFYYKPEAVKEATGLAVKWLDNLNRD